MASHQTPDPTGSTRASAPAARPRRRWRWLIVGGVLLALFLGRAPLLRGLAGLLIADEPDQGATALALLGGDRVHDAVAARVRDGGDVEVLLIAAVPRRLEAFGLIPPHTEIDRRALEGRGVPAAAIRVLPGQARDAWDGARVPRDWLRDHPEARVTVLCDRFGSRRLRIILDRVLGPDAARARVAALADRRYDETNWWRSEAGFTCYATEYVKLAYYGLGEDRSCQLTVLALAALLAGTVVVRRLRRPAAPARVTPGGEAEGQRGGAS